MSKLISFTLRKTTNLFKTQCFRVLQKHSQHRIEIINKTRMHTATPKYTSINTTELNANVAKDVVLFKYENPRFYNMLNVFAISQLIFWTYLSHFAFTTLKDAPVDHNHREPLKWYQKINLGENKYKNGISICCFAIGYGIFVSAWMFILRSVRFLILRRGGKEISIVTYGPFNKNRIMTVPLKCISAEESRQLARVQLPIKVKNKTLYYVLDMRGEFRNPKLFDNTVGLRRNL